MGGIEMSKRTVLDIMDFKKVKCKMCKCELYVKKYKYGIFICTDCGKKLGTYAEG